MSEELKSCPNPWCPNPKASFVGTYHSIQKCYIKDVSVICLGCGIKLNKDFKSEAEAIAAWNHRPIEDALRKEIKGLQDQTLRLKELVLDRERRIKELEAWQKEAVIYLNKFSFVDGKETGWNLEDNEAIELETLIERAEEHGNDS